MEFRPCIDIHNGKVKQIVGSSISDAGDTANDNFVSSHDAEWYADLYKSDNIKGAHVIILNSRDSEYYEADKAQAVKALQAYPGALQIGGGITAENAGEFINAGASHVIVTSYVFKNGKIDFENLSKLKAAVGKEHIVLDLSAAPKAGKYFVVTDRWQKFSEEEINTGLFEVLKESCDEFLVHGTNAEGKRSGIDTELVKILADIACGLDVTITYAGGISSYGDIDTIKNASGEKLNFTVGSALDLFGGNLEYKKLLHAGSGI